MAIDQIRVNKNQYGWGSISVTFDGDVIYGFDSIEFADKRERTKGYGAGGNPRGRSRGKYSTDPVKLRCAPSTAQLMRDRLAAKSSSGTEYGDIEFEITVKYFESAELPMLVSLQRGVWTGNRDAYEEGSEVLKTEIEIDIFRIVRNGKCLFDADSGS